MLSYLDKVAEVEFGLVRGVGETDEALRLRIRLARGFSARMFHTPSFLYVCLLLSRLGVSGGRKYLPLGIR